ncbi:hypothetical protein PPYR_02819 [Photinus pyralis]|uniref:Small acidic protein-like domain-containing protein n=2 Tax=Photinus pyralis TaxID=7054 RepID=A0A5N4A145_PHOPY|nr:arginine/serine-rich coiled-coil protein 2 [Photinus pyralis]KAB0791019.1 hypothetical protein PPYR_02819 [Photinus pyralis]
MESLIGYGSDDDYDDHSHSRKQHSSQADANYEEVQMDLSEDSNDSAKFDKRRQSKDYHSKYKDDVPKEKDKYKYEHARSSPKYQDSRGKDPSRDRRRSRDREDRRSRDREDRRSRDREDRRSRDREDRRSRDREDRRSWEDDRDHKRDRSRDEKARYRDNRRSKDDYKEDRHTYRASSRERHRSRSPKRSKRSSSRERVRGGYSKRFDRSGNKMDRLEKLGIDLKPGAESAGSSVEVAGDKAQDKDRFFMPGITGRFTEQIQRRKMLWQKKDAAAPAIVTAPPTQTQKVWQNTTFAQDTDGKVANKFKRLMGIRGSQPGATKPANDSLRKQEEMFTSMEAQYEVARTATHTMRGVGLGFGAFQR